MMHMPEYLFFNKNWDFSIEFLEVYIEVYTSPD